MGWLFKFKFLEGKKYNLIYLKYILILYIVFSSVEVKVWFIFYVLFVFFKIFNFKYNCDIVLILFKGNINFLLVVVVI